MAGFVDILWMRTWWRYADDTTSWPSVAYHAFNLCEGTAWLVFCGLVLIRRQKSRRSVVELWYAFAFFTFGLSDFREAYYQQSWLIWLKAINLAALFALRHYVITRLYPTSRLY